MDMTPESHSETSSSNLVIAAGLGLGLLGDILIGDVVAPGPGLALWVALFALSACWLAYRHRSAQLIGIIVWSAVAFSAALMLAFRTLPVVILLMCLVMLTAAAMVLMALQGIELWRSRLSDHIAAGFRVPLQAVTGAIPVMGAIDVRHSARHGNHLAVLRGVLIALPLLLLFGSLFSQADLKFEGLATEALSVFSPEFPAHLLITIAYFWLATGLLAALYKDPAPARTHSLPRFSLGREETLIVMGTLVALFLTFVILQLPYLFGGRDIIEATPGLSLAEYARRGFFELVVVSGLSLGILLVMASITLAPGIFRPLAGVLLTCVLLILASAMQRLFLYTQGFGLTIDRITAFTFLVWVAFCLLLYGLIILRGRTTGFAMGMTGSGVAIAFLLALVNPAAVVVNFNTSDELTASVPLDVNYLSRLGSEAIPALLDHIDRLPANEQCMFARRWLSILDRQGGEDDWRTWNLIDSRAGNAIAARAGELTAITEATCPPPGPALGRPPLTRLGPPVIIRVPLQENPQ